LEKLTKKAEKSSKTEQAKGEEGQKIEAFAHMSHIDALVSKVQKAMTMKGLSQSMTQVTKGLDEALSAMDPQRMSAVMDRQDCRLSESATATPPLPAMIRPQELQPEGILFPQALTLSKL
ncbi:hypothetical protein STEG23_030247, partial [Scotinomys teguina]